jgi:hypothetical protein
VKRLLATLLLLVVAARAENWAPNLTLGATWNNNATNADRSADRISTVQTTADVVANERYAFGRDDAVHFGLHAAGEWWPRYQGLATGELGARADWQHKFGLGALPPVFAVELAGDYVAAKETGRRGNSAGVTIAFRKRFNDLWRASLSQEFNRMFARYAVYDKEGAQTTLELGRDLTEVSRLTFSLFYREGDIVSYATPPRPDIVPLAPNRMLTDTFDRSLVAYSIDAKTTGTKLAYIRALDQASALVVGYEYRKTARDSLSYVNQLVSLALVHQF